MGYINNFLNIGLDGAVVGSNNHWRKREKDNGGEAGLSILATYTQVKNGLVLKLRYLEAF